MAAITPGTLAEVAADPALAELYEAKAQTYASFGNGAIAAHARAPAASRAGACSTSAAPRAACSRCCAPRAGHLAGVELSATAATAAAQVADHVVQGALEDPDLPFEEGSFDLVVLADVLEHLADPAAGLARAVRWCRPGGAVLVSVPNVAHWQARLHAPARALAADRQRHLRRQPPALVHPRRGGRAAHAGPGCATSNWTRSSPALRNHAPAAAGPLVGAPGARLAGARAPRPRAARLSGRRRLAGAERREQGDTRARRLPPPWACAKFVTT